MLLYGCPPREISQKLPMHNTMPVHSTCYSKPDVVINTKQFIFHVIKYTLHSDDYVRALLVRNMQEL